jgi:hypothetical protein
VLCRSTGIIVISQWGVYTDMSVADLQILRCSDDAFRDSGLCRAGSWCMQMKQQVQNVKAKGVLMIRSQACTAHSLADNDDVNMNVPRSACHDFVTS